MHRQIASPSFAVSITDFCCLYFCSQASSQVASLQFVRKVAVRADLLMRQVETTASGRKIGVPFAACLLASTAPSVPSTRLEKDFLDFTGLEKEGEQL